LFLLSLQKGEKTLSVEDLQKALDTLVREIRNYPRDVWESQLNDFLKLFSVFQKDYDLQVHVPRKQLSELDTTQWLIEHEAEIQNHFQRPIIQLSRGQILGYFIDKELLEAQK
jgi:hypothetical protein